MTSVEFSPLWVAISLSFSPSIPLPTLISEASIHHLGETVFKNRTTCSMLPFGEGSICSSYSNFEQIKLSLYLAPAVRTNELVTSSSSTACNSSISGVYLRELGFLGSHLTTLALHEK